MRALVANLVALLLLALPWTARAEQPAVDALKRKGELLWGADQQGGGPYVFPRDDDPSRVTGFEVDLAGALGTGLGVKATFAQGDWDKLPDLLKAKKVDVVLNGYEWSPERADAFEATIPYYVYRLVLLARTKDKSVGAWDDLKKAGAGGKRRIGVLGGSAADAFAKRYFGASADVVSYDGSTDAMREVETGKLDATIQDTPIASFYAPRFPELRAVGEPKGKGHYVMFVRKGEADLARALSRTLARMVESGELERLYAKWRLWNPDQAELLTIVHAGRYYGATVEAAPRMLEDLPPEPGAASPPPPEAEIVVSARKHGLEVVRAYGWTLVQSAGMTVFLSFASFPLAVALGLGIALGRRSGPRPVQHLLAVLVEALRGTPLMLQLYFLFFLLPEIGVKLPALATSILGLAVNYAAYESEIYRSALGAVPKGQTEAGLSLGLGRAQVFRLVVLPQAARIALPPTVNDFIALFKDTSVCSVVTVVELTKRTSVLSQSTQATVELMLMSGALYLLMSYPLSRLAGWLERRLAPHEERAT